MERKPTLTTIAIEKLHPHPDNPRKVLGDIDELADSIKANGILQNLTVVPMNDDWTEFTVIIGHRRLAAAKQAGLTELPCAVVEMTEKEQLSTMLTENMQRSDLTVYEEAKGCQLLLDLGDTVAEIAEKTGFSEYALCQTNYSSFSYISVSYLDKTISRKNNTDLNRFYNLLCKLGYVMSDEEIQLRDGTHPIFTSGEVK